MKMNDKYKKALIDYEEHIKDLTKFGAYETASLVACRILFQQCLHIKQKLDEIEEKING